MKYWRFSLLGILWFPVSVLSAVPEPAGTNSAPPGVSFSGIGEAREAVWTVETSADGRSVRFSVVCSGVSAIPVLGGYSLRMPGQAGSSIPGAPDTPRLARLLPGLKGVKVHVRAIGLDSTNVNGVAVAAAEGYRLDETEGSIRVLRPFREPDPAVYGINQYWPPALARIEEASVGTQDVVRVECCPIQYNPVEGGIRFYRRVEGELTFGKR